MRYDQDLMRTLVLLACAFAGMVSCSRANAPAKPAAQALPVNADAGSAQGNAGVIAPVIPTGPVIPLFPDTPVVIPADDASAPDEPLTAESSCGQGKAQVKLEPVSIFVMIDRSGSMLDDNKWIDATAALLTFFRDPKAAGMRIALRFFPHDVPVDGCTDTGCDPLACSQPLVPLGELSAEYGEPDTQERALVLGIARSNPGGNPEGGGTPIHAALDGALRWATSHHVSHPREKVAVVFVTDGEPNGCDVSFDNIAALATTALQSSGVTTYAIGLAGANAAQIDRLAQAGGTARGIFVDPGPAAEQALVTALNGIRDQTLSCDFALPAPTDPNTPIDPTHVNVTFTPTGGEPGTLSQVPDPSACGTRKSWYYDAPANPTQIGLCPAACDLVRDDTSASLEVLLGCATACGGLDMSCGGTPPTPEVPPVLF